MNHPLLSRVKTLRMVTLKGIKIVTVDKHCKKILDRKEKKKIKIHISEKSC